MFFSECHSYFQKSYKQIFEEHQGKEVDLSIILRYNVQICNWKTDAITRRSLSRHKTEL